MIHSYQICVPRWIVSSYSPSASSSVRSPFRTASSAPNANWLERIATETPEGLLNIKETAAASPRVAAISWGIEDLSAAMGLPRTRDAEGRFLDIPRHARVMCAVAASAAGVEAIDTVYTDIHDLEGLRRECQEAVWMGFSGKTSIHPGQLAVINEVFTPSRVEAEEAVALISAFEAEARRGTGAFAWKGQMMDMPHLTRARKIAERARRAGVL